MKYIFRMDMCLKEMPNMGIFDFIASMGEYGIKKR